MFREGNYYTGDPARVYRSAREIRRDMHSISIRIKEANERLNLRSILIDIISDLPSQVNRDPSFWISELEAAITDAREAYDMLSGLNEELSMLEEELLETRCAMGI